MTDLNELLDRLQAMSTEIAIERIVPYLAMRGLLPLSDRDWQILVACLPPIAFAVVEVPEFGAIVREVSEMMPSIPPSPER